MILFTASVGRYHNAAVTKKNELYVWGANESGQVGDGSTSDQEEPVLIFSDAKTISLGDRHSAAILTNDDLYVSEKIRMVRSEMEQQRIRPIRLRYWRMSEKLFCQVIPAMR